MDQSTLMLLLATTLMAAQPGRDPGADGAGSATGGTVVSCGDVSGARPPLMDIRLLRPFGITRPAEQDMLRGLAAFMRSHNCSVTIEGYSDERGSEAAKQRAALQRAEAVRDYLVRGLPASERVRSELLHVSGKGELKDPARPREQKQIARVVL